MPARTAFDYAIVRVVPDVAREEFVNVGVVLHARAAGFLGCAVALDRARVCGLAPGLDEAQLRELDAHLAAFSAVVRGDPEGGPIAALPTAERFHWLVAPRSTIVQTSAVHGGVTDDPARTLAELFERRVAPSR